MSLRDAARRVAAALLVVVVVGMAGSGCTTLGFRPSIDTLIEQGIELYQAGSYDESIAKFEEVIRRDPERWVAYLYLARSFVVKKDWPAAILNGRKALGLQPEDGDVLRVLADALFEAGLDALRHAEYGAAVRHLVEYVGLRPGDARGYSSLARAYVGEGSFARAGESLVEGLRRGETKEGQADLLGELLDTGGQALGAGNPEAALDMLSAYLAREPRSVEAWLALGKAAWASGDASQAMGAFRRALQLSPGNEEARRLLSR